MPRILATATALLVAGLVACPVSASANTQPPQGAHALEHKTPLRGLSTRPDFATSEGEPGRYVAAESPEDALEILNSVEAGLPLPKGVSYGPCVLHPSPIRIRSGGEVGTKPQTKCTKTVSSIRQSTDLRYHSFIWWKLKGTKTSENSHAKKLLQRKVAFSCSSDEQTSWASTTLGTVVFRGKTYYSRVYPPIKSLKCGG